MQSLYKTAKRLGPTLSMGHHSQAMLLVLALSFVLLKAWWSLPGLALYMVMHVQYGGSGAFQHPSRDNDERAANVADLLYVSIGLLGVVGMLAGITVRATAAFS